MIGRRHGRIARLSGMGCTAVTPVRPPRTKARTSGHTLVVKKLVPLGESRIKQPVYELGSSTEELSPGQLGGRCYQIPTPPISICSLPCDSPNLTSERERPNPPTVEVSVVGNNRQDDAVSAGRKRPCRKALQKARRRRRNSDVTSLTSLTGSTMTSVSGRPPVVLTAQPPGHAISQKAGISSRTVRRKQGEVILEAVPKIKENKPFKMPVLTSSATWKSKMYVDNELYGYLLLQAVNRVRSPQQLTILTSKGRRWLDDHDVTEFDDHELAEMLARAVAAVMNVSEAEQGLMKHVANWKANKLRHAQASMLSGVIKKGGFHGLMVWLGLRNNMVLPQSN